MIVGSEVGMTDGLHVGEQLLGTVNGTDDGTTVGSEVESEVGMPVEVIDGTRLGIAEGM